jgi:hypothetical protein
MTEITDYDVQVQAVVDGISSTNLEKTVRDLAAFPTRHTLSGTLGADAAASYLANEFTAISSASDGRLLVEKDTWNQPEGRRIPEAHDLTNVIATLPGTETPERVIIVSGHYDSRAADVMGASVIAPGANDDASGVAVVVELARVMAGRSYSCTVIFAALTGEEQGLYGASHLAEQMEAAGRGVIAMITNDTVGSPRGEGGIVDDKHIRVFSAGYNPAETPEETAKRRLLGTETDSPSRTFARGAADTVRRYVSDFSLTLVYRNDRCGRSGDHTPFMQKGYAAVRLTEPNEDWRHQHQDIHVEDGVPYGDLPEFVDFAYLTQVARANAAIVADLASAPPAPTNVRMEPDLSPNTTLYWTVPSTAVACEVLWRKTTDAEWQASQLVQKTETTVALPLSKDDYIFAVRAVSESGARSLPALPVYG